MGYRISLMQTVVRPAYRRWFGEMNGRIVIDDIAVMNVPKCKDARTSHADRVRCTLQECGGL